MKIPFHRLLSKIQVSGQYSQRYSRALKASCALALASVSTFSQAQTLLDQFQDAKTWKLVGQVEADKKSLKILSKGQSLLINGKDKNSAPYLKTRESYGDISMKLEFMIPKGSNSGVYFMGRYEIQIYDSFGKKNVGFGDLGGLYRRDKGKGKPADVNAAKAPGEWQTMEAVFRAPRFAKDGSKIGHAEFLKVLINGQQVHQNVFAKGPTVSAIFKDENVKGPLVIQGDHGPIVIRSLEIKTLDLSDHPGIPLNLSEMAPLDNKGEPKIDVVAAGDEAFHNKGCSECHSTTDDQSVNKTGPSLYGLLRKQEYRHAVIESAERHPIEVITNEDYIRGSVRNSTRYLALNEKDANKPYLPIMPSYTPELLLDSELEAIIAYLKTLNREADQGPLRQWISKPNPQYVLSKDKTATWVKNYPRLKRVDIGPKHSGRAYHVGLPGDINYSFDPRTLGIVEIWNGPFLSLRNEKDGRANRPSTYGHNATVWPSLNQLFQPYYRDGTLVDFSYKEPAEVDERLGKSLLADTSDYVAKVKAYKAGFLGVETPPKAIPSFRYHVEGNKVELKFIPNSSNGLEARFSMNLKQAQTFHVADNLASVEVTAGELVGSRWTVPAGDHAQVVFKAKYKDAPAKVFTVGDIPQDSLKGQALSWTKAKKASDLPMGYSLSDGRTPLDRFGREQLFEPLGIDFLNENVAFVATRTAGIWKVVNGQWHLFAEGTFESLGVVAESENSIVIGEKPGLTRLYDKDGDHWAESRDNLSDQFRFNGNYHEYLHGPIKLGDSYIYNLNLSHGVAGNYKAGGAFMGTIGGLRGWMLEVDGQGQFNTFANGFRSPAGLALSPAGEIIFTENQGEYVGTSKIFTVNRGKFYGNPTGMVDLPGKNNTSPEVQWDTLKNRRELPSILLPHGRVANSPGNPVWDTSEGKFGPFSGQMLLGDQSLSNIYRIDIETINGIEQGAALPFANDLPSGVMRLAFNPADNSLWLGETGRGWTARGGAVSALQRITWDGRTPDAIKTIKVTAKGFQIEFTQAQQVDDFGKIALSSWHYRDSPNYGSGERGKRDEVVLRQQWSQDRRTCFVELKDFSVAPKVKTDTSRVYQIRLQATAFGRANGKFQSEAFYTLHTIPGKTELSLN